MDKACDKISACALHIDGNTCLDKKIVKLLVNKFKLAEASVDSLKKYLNVEKEIDILPHQLVVEVLGDDAIKIHSEIYKPEGTLDFKPLNNTEIDSVLDQWKNLNGDYVNLHVNMIDFEKYGGTMSIPLRDIIDHRVRTGSSPFESGEINLLSKNKSTPKCIACVVNSDTHGGGGKHWVCVFVDLREDPWTLEFFNSSGNPPYDEIRLWWAKNEIDLKKYVREKGLNVDVERVRASDIVHQKSNTECGPYTLYYIYSRLTGIPHTYFKHNEIVDDVVTKFKKTHCFRPQ